MKEPRRVKKYTKHFHSQKIENIYLSCGHINNQKWLGRGICAGACGECLHKAALLAQKIERERCARIAEQSGFHDANADRAIAYWIREDTNVLQKKAPHRRSAPVAKKR